MAFWQEGFWKLGLWKPGFWKGMGEGSSTPGVFILFHRFLFDLGRGEHDLSQDTFRLALLADEIELIASLANPTWGSEGTNMRDYQVRPGGNYADDGFLLHTTFSMQSGIVSWDAEDDSILPLAGSPTDVRYGLIYNHDNRKCVGFIDYVTLDLSQQPLAIDFSTSGLVRYG